MNNNLKPFNLKRALAGDPVVTRGGKKVLEIYCFKTKQPEQPILVDIGDEYIRHYSLNGAYYHNGPIDKDDLFMAPIEKEYWCLSALNTKSRDAYFSDAYSLETESELYTQLLAAWKKSENLIDIQEHKITRLE
jgi:hypothetical protein